MNTPRVHLLMPVYNSFSYERSDGKKLLPLAINSLLRQTFKNFELIILDNQSTDDTPTICREYAKKDSRVRFIVDDEKRFAEAAITKLGSMATAPYCMIINDDDMWDEHYIEEAVKYAEANPKADLVYGKCLFINPHNILTGFYAAKEDQMYGENLPPLGRFVRYASLRNILPIHYGLFKTEAFKRTLPYEDFDTLKSNIDNVFMSKFFALGYRADYCDKLMFFYRRKSRTLTPSKFAPNMPALHKPIGIWLFYANHQMLFFSKLFEMAGQQGFSGKALEFIRTCVMMDCIQTSLNLIRWTKQEIEVQGKYVEASKIHGLEKEFKSNKELNNLDYSNPEKLIHNGEVSLQGLNNLKFEAKKTLLAFKDFVKYAGTQENDSESKDFASKIIRVIDGELAWYTLQNTDSRHHEKTATKKTPSFYSKIVEKIRDYPLLKKSLIGMLSIYLTVRFFPTYISTIVGSRNKNEKTN